MITREEVFALLDEVKDPEIPVLSLVDLGVITDVSIKDDSVKIEMTPTFVGCPAIEYMRNDVLEKLHAHGIHDASVEVNFRKAWTSDRITEKGKEALRQFGLAPPPSMQLVEDLDILESATCPRCGGDHTELRNPFGPTLCRSIYYCNDCKEAFEQFKPL